MKLGGGVRPELQVQDVFEYGFLIFRTSAEVYPGEFLRSAPPPPDRLQKLQDVPRFPSERSALMGNGLLMGNMHIYAHFNSTVF